MKKFLLIGFCFLPKLVWGVTPVITPATPVSNQGATVQFSETLSEPGTWSCSATNSTGGVTACSGSINSGTGLYTAPSSVTAQHWYGGVQIGPNNSVFNTRIDSAPVNPLNTLWTNAVNVGGSPNWNTDFPINYVSSAFTNTLNFHFTPLNNGIYEVPVFPNAKAENGWFNNLQQRDGADHHVVMVDSTTGNLSEFYNYGPNCLTSAASVTSGIATVTCTTNPLANGFLVGSTVVVGGFTGSDTYFNVTSASMTAVTATSISYPLAHADATASTNGSVGKWVSYDTTGLMNSGSGIVYSSMTYVLPKNNTTDAAGMELQPMLLSLQELERAVTTGGTINHAMRNTFALGFEANYSTWPATTYAVDPGSVPFGARMRLKASFDISGFSPIAQVLLTNQKQYGTLNCDGGNNYPMNAETTRWPKPYYDALLEIASSSTIAGNMEFIQSSVMMVSTSSSLTKYNREMVTFTRTSDASSTTVDVALMGPAVNFAKDQVNIMAGTPAQQLQVLNNYGGYSCSMSPSTGTLTSGCLYTPPATLSAATTTIITATSLVNSSATAIMTLMVFPSTGIYVIPSRTSNYTDAFGNTWIARAGIASPDNQSCCACDNSAHFPAVTDVSLFSCYIPGGFSAAGDQHMDFNLPNGTYQVVYHYGTQFTTGGQFFKYTIGNTEIYPNVDPSALAGGQYQLFTTTNTKVSNNLLQVGIYGMNSQGGPVSSLSITLSSGTTFTSSQSGFWGSSTTWGNVGVPGYGDRAVISNGHTVTSTYTVTTGSSPAGGAEGSVGTYAVLLNGSGQLVVSTATSFTAQGDIQVAATGHVILEPGTTLQFDASNALSPMSQNYRLNGTGTNSYEMLIASCTATQRCSVYSNSAGGNAYIDDGALLVNSYGGGIFAHYTDFQRIGDASHRFSFVWTQATTTGNNWDVQNCTFDSCGMIDMTNGTLANDVVIHKNNVHTNTLMFSPLKLNAAISNSGGVREVGNNVFDKIVNYFGGNQGWVSDFNFHDNYFGLGFTSQQQPGSNPIASFTNNFVRQTSANYSFVMAGGMTKNYVVLDDYHMFHVHDPDNTGYQTAINISSNVFETTYLSQNPSNEVNDGITDTVAQLSLATFTVTYNLEPCGSTPGVGQNLASVWKLSTTTWHIDHNTACSGNSFTLTYQESFFDGEHVNLNRGSITNNIWYDSTNRGMNYAFQSFPSTNPWTDPFQPSMIQKNGNWNVAEASSLSTTSANSYIAVWSSTPGATDFNSNPQFLDSTRNYGSFDSSYLGHVASATWASKSGSYTFAPGEIVSDSSGTYFSGQTFNYRCVTAHTKNTANSEPGVGSSYPTYWEFATNYDIRNAVGANLTINDSTLNLSSATYVQALIAWEMQGYSPRNATYINTATDGTNVGASQNVLSSTSALQNIWFGDGGYKESREEQLPYGTCSTCTQTRNWDGHTAKQFSGKNETTSLVLYMGAGAVDVSSVSAVMSDLVGTDGTRIPFVTVSSNSVVNISSRPIQQFYARYLPVKGLTFLFAANDYEQRWTAPRLRMPFTVINGQGVANPGSLWTDRADHDKNYPDILVPNELVPTYTVAASSSQEIWWDIYVSSSVPAQTYTGTITVFTGVNISTTIPVQLLVYPFTLPQKPTITTMVYAPAYDINYRHQGTHTPPAGQPYQLTRDIYAQNWKAHGMTVIGDQFESATDALTPEYVSHMNGGIYLSTAGYGSARGIGLGDKIYSIGTYGVWQVLWSTSNITNFCGHVKGWQDYFLANYPDVTSFVYLDDEPLSLTNSNVWSTWMTTTSICQTAGYRTNSFVTADAYKTLTFAPNLNMPASVSTLGVSSATWQSATLAYETGGSTQPVRYNTPVLGGSDCFALDEDGTGCRQMYWGLYKKGIKTQFFWDGVHWTNGSNDVPVFQDPVTFGSFTSTSTIYGHTGTAYSNLDGVLVYPGTDVIINNPSYGINGPISSIREKMIRRGIQDYDYITLANNRNQTATQVIVSSMVPQVLWDYQCHDLVTPDCTYAFGDRSWTNSAGAWETARELLANIAAYGATARKGTNRFQGGNKFK